MNAGRVRRVPDLQLVLGKMLPSLVFRGKAALYRPLPAAGALCLGRAVAPTPKGSGGPFLYP